MHVAIFALLLAKIKWVHQTASVYHFAGISIESSKPVPALPNDTITLTCTVKNSQSHTYRWSLNDVPLNETTPTLVISDAGPQDLGLYKCVASHHCNSKVATLQLTLTSSKLVYKQFIVIFAALAPLLCYY